ncbi:MAG TPA: AAA family ATPase [Smithellaceae bacterium]|nr:AAA family ATPase [Smithellaceae bacterium]
MRISRITKIREHRIFKDFVWSSELPAFAQFNVIYGWNWSGKTTLSSLFTYMQEKRAITEGQVEFELDNGSKITGSQIPAASVPAVRVFNRNFVARTIEAIQINKVTPIYYLGAESIEQQKQAEAWKIELEKAREAVTKAQTSRAKAERDLDSYCIEKARLIKEALLGSSSHANYDKRTFKEAIKRLKNISPLPNRISNAEKDRLRKQKELQAKPDISRLSISIPDLGQIRSRTEELLNQSVVSQVMDELVRDADVGTWVQKGLSLHKGERGTNICRFCGKELSPERLAQLEAHFNDSFASFVREIGLAIDDVEKKQKDLRIFAPPDESRFYDHLAGEVSPCVESAKRAIVSIDRSLDLLKSSMGRKNENPFERLVFDNSGFTDGTSDLSVAVDKINAAIEKHVTTTKNLGNETRNAYNALEQDYLLEFLPGLDGLNSSVTAAESALANISSKPKELEEKIAEIERQIVEHRKPAEELNKKLCTYLGHGELTFEVKETGYALLRNGQPASDLSEGERTAIAFLYFLKSLKDKGFDLSKGVVVIDDPVSSLDANALFSAFGYMKERTKGCHQLFILTHNFAFFRQVKNWFHHLKDQKKRKVEKRPARFYLLQAAFMDGMRSAKLMPIDPLLEQFESEYHFLFKQVHHVANDDAPVEKLEYCYGMPNMARRLVETFLSYRLPDCSGDLINRFEKSDFDAAKKTRILRFLNTYSHASGISEPEHDPTMLAETKDVMKLLLEMIQAMDPQHYQGMERIVISKEEAEE